MAAVVSYCKPSPFLGQFPSHYASVSQYGNWEKPLSRQRLASSGQACKVSALFWGSKKSVESRVSDVSLGNFTLTGSGSEGGSADQVTPKKLSISVHSSISEVSPDEWDACNLDATGPEKANPFLTHGFLSSLEESGCAVKETGWMPSHIVAKDECENILGVVPLYLKSHSYGEFVFDHSWADAYYGFGSRYYPKFQCCVPFTPVTGPRILVRNISFRDEVFDIIASALKDLTAKEKLILLKKAKTLIPDRPRYHAIHNAFQIHTVIVHDTAVTVWSPVRSSHLQLFIEQMQLGHGREVAYSQLSQVSSLHITFPSENEWHKLKEQGFLQRIGMQYHWKNRNYKNFDEFLMDLKQSKRKNIRQERKKISAQNLTMKRLRGDDIKATHWDSFYNFYRNTTDNKWGTPYLTRDFFHNMGSKMGDRVLLVVAEQGGELVAGALNIIGGDTLFGRLWGCDPRAYYPSLHFEACYYQAIEAAIELDLSTVEAGAQGEHKIQRGYLPVPTYSCHYLVDEPFRKAIGEFLVRESSQVKLVMKLIQDSGPFKEGIQ